MKGHVLALALSFVAAGCGSDPRDPGDAGGELDASTGERDGGGDEDASSGGCGPAERDRDGDGVASIACGGSDCDDEDPERYPGRDEVCDAAAHDEDCDPTTYGFRDADSDGVPDARCCNVDAEGERICGTDCDDMRPGVGSAVPEVCNDLDDDCDGIVDELVQRTFYPDLDGDGFGDGAGTATLGCNPPPDTAENGTDCDDDDGGVNPGVPEICNGADDDCSGTPDDAAASASCRLASTAEAACSAGACAVVRCDEGRADCNGIGLDGCEVELASDVDHCGTCDNRCDASGGSARCEAGLCQLGCPPGSHACGGSCVDSASPASCGTRCEPCPEPATDGAAICLEAACSVECASSSHVVVGSGASLDCAWGDPSLASLAPSLGALVPTFAPDVTEYLLVVPALSASVALTPALPSGAVATVRVGGSAVASGASSAPQSLSPAPTWIDVEVEAESGATRTYRVQVVRSFAAQHYVKPSAGGSGRDQFGWATAIDGDTLVIGAPFEDAPGGTITQAGAVHVLVRGAGGAWAEQAILRASNAGTNDLFGVAVGIDGDTIVVGAQGERSLTGDPADDGASSAGAAYVFVRSGTTWTQQAYLKSPSPEFRDYFGIAVAISGDTVVVGADGEDTAAPGVDPAPDELAPDAGAAFVFVRSGTTWSLDAFLKPSSPDAGDRFGSVLAISGDTIAISAPGEDSASGASPGNDSAVDAGAAYVFVRSAAAWSQQAYLKPAVVGAGDTFGESIAIDGDTIVIGADDEDGGSSGVGGDATSDAATGAGAAYVFVRSGATWTQQAYLKASNTGAGDWFGVAVAISGDTIVVGAPGEDSASTTVDGDALDDGAPDAGAAYVFVRTGTTWRQVGYLKASNAESGDIFGIGLAVSAEHVLVGARGEGGTAAGIDGDGSLNGLFDAGAAYLFRR